MEQQGHMCVICLASLAPDVAGNPCTTEPVDKLMQFVQVFLLGKGEDSTHDAADGVQRQKKSDLSSFLVQQRMSICLDCQQLISGAMGARKMMEETALWLAKLREQLLTFTMRMEGVIMSSDLSNGRRLIDHMSTDTGNEKDDATLLKARRVEAVRDCILDVGSRLRNGQQVWGAKEQQQNVVVEDQHSEGGMENQGGDHDGNNGEGVIQLECQEYGSLDKVKQEENNLPVHDKPQIFPNDQINTLDTIMDINADVAMAPKPASEEQCEKNLPDNNKDENQPSLTAGDFNGCVLSDHALQQLHQRTQQASSSGENASGATTESEIQVNVGNEVPAQWTCQECRKVCKTKAILTRHQLTHLRGKSEKCGECGKPFKPNDNLKGNKKSDGDQFSPHHGKPVCRKCTAGLGVRPKRRGSKKLNLVVKQTRQLLHLCTSCNRAFSAKQSLIKHVKETHASEVEATEGDTNVMYTNPNELKL